MEASAGLIAGSGWASGLNLYGVMLLLGVFQRYGDADLPELLGHPAVLAVAAGLYLVEFAADKVPYLDNAWDVLHTAIRPLGAAGLGYLLAGEASTAQHAFAAVGSGTLAFAGHAAKATARAAINSSPEPFSTIGVSLLEDGIVAGMIWFAVEHPVIAGVAVVVFLVAGVWLMVSVWRLARAGIGRLRERLGGRRSQSRPGTW